MIDFHLETPEPVLLAREKKRGLHWVPEILVFVAVFLVGTLAQLVFMLSGEIFMLAGNADYQAAATAGDQERMAEIASVVWGSDGYMVLALLSDIMLIAVVLLFCRVLQKRGPASLGFTRKGMGREYLAGAGFGFVAFSAAVLLCVVTGSLRLEGLSPAFRPGMLLLLLAGYLVQGMAEEVLCRGYFMVSFARRWPLWAAVAANALAFAALHLANKGIGVLALVNLVLYGVFASLYFIKRGNIWGIGAFHSLWNFVQGNFYGVLVSGNATECTLFQSTAVEGRELINGGAFGLEGGLAVTVVLAVGCLVLLTRRQRLSDCLRSR